MLLYNASGFPQLHRGAETRLKGEQESGAETEQFSGNASFWMTRGNGNMSTIMDGGKQAIVLQRGRM